MICKEQIIFIMKIINKYLKKQEKILEAAKSLFLSQGYRTTSMDEVAEKAGVTKQTVYRYFPSKEELFKAMLNMISPVERKHAFGDGDVRDELILFADKFVTQHLSDERLGIFRLMITEGDKAGGIGEVFFNIGPQIRHKNLSDYFEKKLITDNPEKDARIFMSMLLYFRVGILIGVSPMPGKEWIDSHCAYVTDLFLSGRRLL